MNVSVRKSAKAALEHAEADGKCRREWVCSCGACRIVRQAVGRLPRDRETVKLDRDLYRANREAKTMSYFR